MPDYISIYVPLLESKGNFLTWLLSYAFIVTIDQFKGVISEIKHLLQELLISQQFVKFLSSKLPLCQLRPANTGEQRPSLTTLNPQLNEKCFLMLCKFLVT